MKNRPNIIDRNKFYVYLISVIKVFCDKNGTYENGKMVRGFDLRNERDRS